MDTQKEAVIVARLEAIENQILDVYGNLVAYSPGADYHANRAVKGKALEKALDDITKDIGNSIQAQAFSEFLHGRLIALKQSPMGNKAQTKCLEHYKKALDLGYHEATVRFFRGMHYKMWQFSDAAKDEFTKVLELERTDSELGKSAADQLNKVSTQKKSGCFIATAVYESEFAPQVVTLREYRDNVLLTNAIGTFFVKMYYIFSPPIARFISDKKPLKKIIKLKILDRLVRYLS